MLVVAASVDRRERIKMIVTVQVCNNKVPASYVGVCEPCVARGLLAATKRAACLAPEEYGVVGVRILGV
jgi:hypothetical protein